MNFYLLVEGKSTELKVYPAWLQHLMPAYSRVTHVKNATDRNYYLVSGEGYPSILGSQLENSVKDFKSTKLYKLLVVALDVDDSTPALRSSEVEEKAVKYGLPKESLRVISQQVCMESWFLGNRRVVSTNPTSPKLGKFLRHYNVRQLDPEVMPKLAEYPTNAIFHFDYFRAVAEDKNFTYSKHNPGQVRDAVFLAELVARANSEQPPHLRTFRNFANVCEEILAAG